MGIEKPGPRVQRTAGQKQPRGLFLGRGCFTFYAPQLKLIHIPQFLRPDDIYIAALAQQPHQNSFSESFCLYFIAAFDLCDFCSWQFVKYGLNRWAAVYKLYCLGNTAIHKNIAALILTLLEAVFVGNSKLFFQHVNGFYAVKPVYGWLGIVWPFKGLALGLVGNKSHDVKIVFREQQSYRLNFPHDLAVIFAQVGDLQYILCLDGLRRLP